MYIENVLAQAEAKAETATPEVVESEAFTEAPAETTEATEQPEAGEESTDISTKQDSELTPEQLAKREANRESHKNSREAKYRREARRTQMKVLELEQKLASLQGTPTAQASKMPTAQSDGRPTAPNADNYSTWEEFDRAKEEYLLELVDWKTKSQSPQQATESSKAQAANEELAQREQYHVLVQNEVMKAIPDYMQVVSEHFNDEGFPQHVNVALFEAENASLALYTLAKEGRLDDLEFMAPQQVAMEIGRAEIRGQKYLNTNRVSKAPPPMRSATGLSTAKKQSPEELLKAFKQ